MKKVRVEASTKKDRTSEIFGNPMSKKVIRKAQKSKQKNQKKYGDDSKVNYQCIIRDNPCIGEPLGVKNVVVTRKEGKGSFDEEKGVIVGNIRMGFGHYRISMAIASAAHALGYTPYWMDLNSYPETTCTKLISAQNELYSLGSRISQKSKLFNKFVWEPVNYEGFRQLSYNAADQKNAELSALEAQIDPHFLYNTLDTINWKAIENEQYEISGMVGALADILRYTVKNAGGTASISEEIAWLKQYIMLQSAKFGKRLDVKIYMPEDVKECRIHKLLLQPFVENTIKYAFADQEECALNIRMKKSGEQLHILIQDNGQGMDPDMVAKLNQDECEMEGHLGIANVRKRLKLYYGGQAALYFESEVGNYTKVHLFIPIEEETTCVL